MVETGIKRMMNLSIRTEGYVSKRIGTNVYKELTERARWHIKHKPYVCDYDPYLLRRVNVYGR